jgi:hypothetical protein
VEERQLLIFTALLPYLMLRLFASANFIKLQTTRHQMAVVAKMRDAPRDRTGYNGSPIKRLSPSPLRAWRALAAPVLPYADAKNLYKSATAVAVVSMGNLSD